MTAAEAAALLRVDIDALLGLAQRNEIPGRRIGADWRFSCASLLEWLDGDWQRMAAVGADETVSLPPRDPNGLGVPLTGNDLAGIAGAGTAQDQSQSTTAGESAANEGESTPIGEASEERTAEDVLLRGQRVLLGPGEAVVDFGQFYAEFNGQPLASIAGDTVLATVEQETLLTSLQGRIGFRNETELFAGTTYFRQSSDAFFGNQKIGSVRASDFGSVNFGLRHTLMRERSGRPDIIGVISTSVPTEGSSYTLGGGLAFVKSLDPVVLFASIGYAHTFSRTSTDALQLEPDDRLDIGFGYALALNDTLALSMSISGVFTGARQFADTEVRQRDSYAVRFGLTSWLARGLYIEPSVSFNLGGPDDSLAFGVTMPWALGR